MKKIILSTLLFVFSLVSFSFAQDLNEKVPFDSSIVTGELENGLEYFIKRNEKPSARVELRLVVNAGSIVEDDDQLGLAHFTEHMAFNGSKNFEKNELVSYLQSVGVKFGAHLNAYTSFDETVYILPIPSDDDAIVEQGLTILEDWAGNVLFEETELDKERGVVIEEWRLGRGASMRMLDEYLPKILRGSQYAKRLPIGTKEILENFDQKTIKRFYQDWYRPNLMAVIAVGDIDVTEMETKIRNHFSGLVNPKNERKRNEYYIPENKEPIVSISSDPEATNIVFNIMYKKDAQPMLTLADYRQGLVESLFTSIVNQRLSDLLQNSVPPYLYAGTYIGSPVSRTMSAFSGYVVTKPDNIQLGISTILDEIRRVELYGFNASEIKVAKLNLLELYESAFKERDKTESAAVVGELVRHFLEQEPVPGIAYEYNFVKQHLDGISVDELNGLVSEIIKDDNRVIFMTAPQQEGLKLPSEDDLLAVVKASEEKELAPLAEEKIDENLIKEDLGVGTIVNETTDSQGVNKLVLSNGATVYLKKTDFKDDEILFSAYRKGGTSTADDDDYWSAEMAQDVVSVSGVGEYSLPQLQKVLAGKSVNLSPYIGELGAGFEGSVSPDDVETLLQLTHLYFTSLRRDEDAYNSLLNRNEAVLKNILSDPNYYFMDKKARILSQNHLRGNGIPSIDDLRKSDLDACLSFFNSQFSSAGNFTFWFVGNFDESNLKPLINKYLGAAKSTKELNWVDRGLRPPSGKVSEAVLKGSEAKSMVNLLFTDEMKFSKEKSYHLRCLSELLDIKLIEVLREEEGGVYGVRSSASAKKSPYSHFEVGVKFPCAPDNVEKLEKLVVDVILDIQKNGVSSEDLNKIKETQRRDMQLSWKENSFWINVMKQMHKSNYDNDYYKWLDARIESLSGKDIQKTAKKHLDVDEYIKIVLYPEDYDKAQLK